MSSKPGKKWISEETFFFISFTFIRIMDHTNVFVCCYLVLWDGWPWPLPRPNTTFPPDLHLDCSATDGILTTKPLLAKSKKKVDCKTCLQNMSLQSNVKWYWKSSFIPCISLHSTLLHNGWIKQHWIKSGELNYSAVFYFLVGLKSIE